MEEIAEKLNIFEPPSNSLMKKNLITQYPIQYGGARGVMVIFVGNRHGDTSSNPGRDWLHFT